MRRALGAPYPDLDPRRALGRQPDRQTPRPPYGSGETPWNLARKSFVTELLPSCYRGAIPSVHNEHQQTRRLPLSFSPSITPKAPGFLPSRRQEGRSPQYRYAPRQRCRAGHRCKLLRNELHLFRTLWLEPNIEARSRCRDRRRPTRGRSRRACEAARPTAHRGRRPPNLRHRPTREPRSGFIAASSSLAKIVGARKQ